MTIQLHVQRAQALCNLVLIVPFLMGMQPVKAAGYEASKPIQVSKFRVVFKEPIEARYAVEGDEVQAYLQQDLVVDGTLIAPADSPVFGHIESVTKTKKLVDSVKSRQERFKRRGSVTIAFDRIAPPDYDQIQIDGHLMPQNAIFSNGEKFRRIIVGGDGEVVKAESLDIKSLNELGISVPETALMIRDRYQINLEPGDNLLVRAEINEKDAAKLGVSAELIKRKKSAHPTKDE